MPANEPDAATYWHLGSGISSLFSLVWLGILIQAAEGDKRQRKKIKKVRRRNHLKTTSLGLTYTSPYFFLSSSITSNGVHEKQTGGQTGNSSEIRSIHLPQLIFINYMSSKLRPCLFSSTGSIALSRREEQASGSVMWSSGCNPKHTVKDVNSVEFNEYIAHPNKYNCLFQGKGICF